MKQLIKKIAVLGIALTLIAGVFTGCKSSKTAETTVELPSFTSVKDQSGELPTSGQIGDMEYRILTTAEYGNPVTKDRGYFIDQLEQLDSPYFIVITSGIKHNKGNEIEIVDFGMQDSTLVIVVKEKDGISDDFAGMNSPCATLEVDHDHYPENILVVTTTGEVLEPIKF